MTEFLENGVMDAEQEYSAALANYRAAVVRLTEARRLMRAAPKRYSPLEVADRLGVCVKTIRRDIKRGMIKATKTGTGQFRISETELQALFAAIPARRAAVAEQRRMTLCIARTRKLRGVHIVGLPAVIDADFDS